MQSSWIPLAMAVVFGAGGIAIVVFRGWVARSVSNLQRATFGRLGEPIASRSTPRATAAIGVMFVLFGVLLGSLSVASLLGLFSRQ